MPFSSKSAARTETANHDAWLTPGRFAALLLLLVLVAYPQVVFGLQTFVYRDFGIFSYPIAYHLRESFLRGEIPLWNPLNNCGIPFLAQWNTQVLYPPALFYVLLPLSWALGVFCLLHLFWGGLGMFVLAQRWIQDRFAAAFAGVVFAFNGLMLNSLMWPATVAALGWMPWVVWLTERAWREGGRTVVLAALAGAMQMLSGGTEVVLLTWVLLGALCVVEFVRGKGGQAEVVGSSLPLLPQGGEGRGEEAVVSGQPEAEREDETHEAEAPQTPVLSTSLRSEDGPLTPSLSPKGEREKRQPEVRQRVPTGLRDSMREFSRRKVLLRTVLVVLLITGLCAAQLLPFFQLLDFSRKQQNISAAMWPMPASGWANFFAPLFHSHSQQGIFMQDGQSWTNSYYVGVATMVLAISALWRARKHPKVWLLAALTSLALVLALGEATPVYSWLLQHVSAIGLMRFPIKFVILPVFALPLLAAFAISERAAASAKPGRTFLIWPGVAAVALVLGLAWWQWRYAPADADRWTVLRNSLTRAACFVAIAAAWFCVNRPSATTSRRWWQGLLLLLVWLDLFGQMPLPQTVSRAVYQPGLARRSSPPQWGQARAQLPSVALERFYHASLANVTDDYLARRFTLNADCNLLDDVPKTDGFYPLYLSDYAALFFNFYRDNVPAEPLRDFLGVSQTLMLESNRYDWQPRATAMPLLTAGQQPRFADGVDELQMLTNADFQPRREVYLPTAAKPFITATHEVTAELSGVSYADERIGARISAAAPTMVVVAQTYYPCWRAYVDDRPARVWPANYAFQALEVPAGVHQVELVYQDRRFYFGAAISLATLGACLGFCCGRRHRRTGVEPVSKLPR
ncbi:MAG: hypothetical protein ABSE16_18460, partial [Verrucomicrobiota bacterium]